MSTICADLIPNIVSYVPLADLRELSKASAIFDIEIYKRNLRILYHSNHFLRQLHKGHKVIKLGNRILFVLENNKWYIGETLQGMFKECHISRVTENFDEFFDSGYFHLDIDDMQVFRQYDECYQLISVDRFDIYGGNVWCFIGDKKYEIMNRHVETSMPAIHSTNILIEYIDFENKYAINVENCSIDYCRFAIAFEDGEWVKQ